MELPKTSSIIDQLDTIDQQIAETLGNYALDGASAKELERIATHAERMERIAATPVTKLESHCRNQLFGGVAVQVPR